MTKESIDEAGGEWAPDQSQVVGDRGYMDKVLKNYFRDVVISAEKNHTRLFLSHLHRPTRFLPCLAATLVVLLQRLHRRPLIHLLPSHLHSLR